MTVDVTTRVVLVATRLVVMVDERLTASELELGLLEQRDLCSAEHPSAEGPLENREKEVRARHQVVR